ncbi:hypothetical protein GCM10009765_84760 [Fodinicola feengrottensis]|uniref:HEAT repeat domain-containing protein n=1 Tax=Fodinicola feengrottensis TaxID=435914 RepID=A0ABP4VKL1_9ACTN
MATQAVKRRRLAHLDAQLTEAITAASPQAQRAIALEALGHIATLADWPEGTRQAVDAANRNEFSATGRTWLADAADRTDDLRLAAEDSDNKGAADHYWRITCAYSAARWVLDDDPSAAAQDAVYHAAMGGDRHQLFSVVRARLNLAPA